MRKLRGGGGVFSKISRAFGFTEENRKTLYENKFIADRLKGVIDSYIRNFDIDKNGKMPHIEEQPTIETLSQILVEYLALDESSLPCNNAAHRSVEPIGASASASVNNVSGNGPDDSQMSVSTCKDLKNQMYNDLYESGKKLSAMMKFKMNKSSEYDKFMYSRYTPHLDDKIRRYESHISKRKDKPIFWWEDNRKTAEENKKTADTFNNTVNEYYSKYLIDENTKTEPIEAQPTTDTLTALINTYNNLDESSLACPDIDCKRLKYQMYEELYDSGNKLREMLDQNNERSVIGSEKYNDYVRIGPILDAKTKKYNDILGKKTKPLTQDETDILHDTLEHTGLN